MRVQWMAAYSGAVLLGACAPAEEASTPDYAADRVAIEAVREAEAAAAEAQDVDEFLALFTDDIQIMQPGAPLVTGTEAAREWLEGFMAAFTVSFDTYTTEDILVDGDLAVERISAVWTLTPTGEGEPITERIKGIHVYERQPDGSWLLSHDVWNSAEVPGEM